MDQKHNTRKIGWLTDKGKVREINEDTVLVTSFGGNFSSVHFLVVADGMGGHAKGEVASKRASFSTSKIVMTTLGYKFDPFLIGTELPAKILKDAIQEANEDIHSWAKDKPGAGMGTTTVCAIVKGNDVTLANVGDSRAYRVGPNVPNGIKQETKDHSLVQELVDKHELTEAQAREDPRKNVITRAVGTSSSLEVDTFSLSLKNDESLLLCSDGVLAHLSDDDIKKIIQETPDPNNACKKIVDMTNERGGSDNISLIILSSEDSGNFIEFKPVNEKPSYEGKVVEVPDFFKEREEKKL
mgnify:FL=1